MPDQVVIRIPPSTPHIGLVRATASALAALQDFTYDQITDMHIAIDEICSRIMATSDAPLSRLEVTFELEAGGIRVTACGDSPLKPGARFLNTLSEAILGSVTNSMEVSTQGGVACATFHVGRVEGVSRAEHA